jgi:hypothetical protein
MHRRILLCSAIAGLSACASNLPPAPAIAPEAAVIDTTIPPFDISSLTADTASADALVLNDLAATAPDDKVFPRSTESGSGGTSTSGPMRRTLEFSIIWGTSAAWRDPGWRSSCPAALATSR